MPWDGYGERAEETYEAVPGLTRLPAWAWRKIPRWGKGVVLALLVVVAGAIVASLPGIDSSKRSAARKTAAAEREARARIAADQRPHALRLRPGAPAVPQLEAAILRDARRRIERPITNVSCTRSGSLFRCRAETAVFSYPFQAARHEAVITWCKRDPPSLADARLDVPLDRRCRA